MIDMQKISQLDNRGHALVFLKALESKRLAFTYSKASRWLWGISSNFCLVLDFFAKMRQKVKKSVMITARQSRKCQVSPSKVLEIWCRVTCLDSKEY